MKKLVLLACSLIVGYRAIAQSSNDAGVTGITSPGISVPASVSQPVTVTIKNYNTSALTAATLGYSVNGVVQPSFAWTGNLAANATSAALNIGNFTFSPGTHTVKAWTSNPNGTVDANKANDTTTISIRTCSVLSGNYTVNKNAAPSATNFTSINEAAQALTNCGISSPVTITVAPNSGTYNEQVTLGVIPGVSATNTVTIEGNGNTLTAATVAAKPGVIIFNGADFVKLNNLKINVDPAAPAGWGIQLINASDNNIISNCTINVPFTLTGSVHTGIFAGTALSSTGNYANNLLVQNNTINGGFNGITIAGTATTNGNRIIGNLVRDSFSSGIYINTGTGTIIEGNDISRPTRTNGGTLYGIYMTGTTTNTVVNKNRIHNTHDVADNTTGQVYGIYNLAVATTGNENIFKNNLFYNINNNGGSLFALYNSGANGAFYYHNTVSADNPAVSYATLRGLHISTTTTTNVKFINNILSLSSAAPAANKHAIYLASTSGITLMSNYNDLYIGNSGHVGYYGADKTTLADWQAVNTNAYDQQSISTDPLFVSATYLQPLAPALNNSGQPLPAVTDAINGVTRSTTTPDMGAYEFTPVAIDAGVTAINTPVSPVIPGNQPVQVTLKNFGTATLTSAIIGWKVNGVSQPDYTWNGSVNSLQTTSVTIGNYTFPAGNFTLKVWSQNPNNTVDGLAVNDTTILSIVSCAPLAGSYTINKNNPTAGTNFQSIMEAVQKLNSCGISAPVTFTVASGTGPYNEQVEFGNIANTSATNTVTFEGSGNTVSTMPGTRPGIFVLNGAKYLKLNNFVITLPATATRGWGVQLMNAADNNTISNNTINLPIASTAADINGIIAGKAYDTPGNNTSNTKILNNIINGGNNGIQINGSTGGLNASNNQIVGNQVRDMFANGIHILDANGTLIEGNDISRPTRINGAIINGIRLFNTCLNTIVSKNRIHNTHDAQVSSPQAVNGIYTGSSATVGNENIIKNNLIYNINNFNAAFTGLNNSVGSGTYYYHNTVMSDPANTYTTLRGVYFSSAATNVKFINNIIWLPSTVTTAKHAIYLLNAGITLVSNNNDLYLGTAPNASSGIGYINAATPANKATLADWKAVNSGAYDQNSVSTDPLFSGTAIGNMKPTAVSMNDLGQPIAAVTDDILGAARNTTTPDMGAYEFGAPANDVSVTNVAVSNAATCTMSATDSVTITIANYGSNTQTSIPVTYSVNNVAIATPETFIGSIAPNVTATYTFATKINLSTPGNYQVVAKTMLGGDILTTNDADTLNVANTMNATLPVAIDFETATTGTARMRHVVNTNSAITESAAASNGGTSTKGMFMSAVDSTNWTILTGTVDPWTSNPNNFASTNFCIAPNTCSLTDSLILTFDLKQLYKGSNSNTNFRVTVDGVQVGPTFRPPFSGTPINWQKIRIDLNSHKNKQTIQIGLESSVKYAYNNGNGTANMIDNIEVKCVAVKPQNTGVKDATLAAQLNVFPNPSTGIFNVELPKGKTYELEVTDLTGKVLKKQTATGATKLNLEETAKGIYLLKVTGENGIAVRKLIVE